MPNNDYLELKEFYHHGIKGQKWGVINKEEVSSSEQNKKNKEEISNNGKKKIKIALAIIGSTLLTVAIAKSISAKKNATSITKSIKPNKIGKPIKPEVIRPDKFKDIFDGVSGKVVNATVSNAYNLVRL